MADRMDVLTAREYEDKATGQTKTSWTKIGTAFKARDGEGWNVILDAFPVSGKLMLREPRQDGERRQQQRPPARSSGGAPPDDGDAPF